MEFCGGLCVYQPKHAKNVSFVEKTFVVEVTVTATFAKFYLIILTLGGGGGLLFLAASLSLSYAYIQEHNQLQ